MFKQIRITTQKTSRFSVSLSVVGLHILRTDQTNITGNVNSNGHPFQCFYACMDMGLSCLLVTLLQKQGDEDLFEGT